MIIVADYVTNIIVDKLPEPRSVMSTDVTGPTAVEKINFFILFKPKIAFVLCLSVDSDIIIY